jgi:hypothetical protein
VKLGRTAALSAIALSALAQIYQSTLPLDHPAIQYESGPLNNAVTRLMEQIASGKVVLERRDGGLGYLPDLLKHLGINADSQALVFSKTSFQATKIGPRNPRAIYFSDDAAVGWVRGSDSLEVAAVDPRQGAVFYTFDAQSRFTRRSECLHCHQGAATAGVPGLFVGSVFPNSSGMPDRTAAIITDHRTPFADRWGGWYVNALHGEQLDRANAMALDPAEPHTLSTDHRQNLPTLTHEFTTTGYLTPTSDIVALMTFEHQTQAINLLTRLGWLARIGGPPEDLTKAVDDTASYLLFEGEAPLREPIEGVSTFTKTFPERGPRDRAGRSLRQFDLNTRLFRYPLSYTIYSAQFDALPGDIREHLYRRLYDKLTTKDESALSISDRRAILEIVRATKSGLPATWRIPGV